MYRGPDDRRENGASRAAAEERRRRFPASRGGRGAANPDGSRCRRPDRRRPPRAQRRSAQLSQWLRDRSLDTRLGPLSLRIPKLRQGSYFPPFLEPRKTAPCYLPELIETADV